MVKYWGLFFCVFSPFCEWLAYPVFGLVEVLKPVGGEYGIAAVEAACHYIAGEGKRFGIVFDHQCYLKCARLLEYMVPVGENVLYLL
ncbi:hypothetical protein V6R21_30420 [Limibacter armeniacum]|uniref:hypothetical protein n=1 Tax=Limibacter armeniacum TaxID=466084 RepID=UPI002FE5FEAF